MSVELLTRHSEADGSSAGLRVISAIGSTVFEKLAQDIDEATEMPGEDVDIKIVNSVTRLGDGQTVPDER